MSSNFRTNAACFVVLGGLYFGSMYGLDRLREGMRADRDRLIRTACNSVSRLVPTQVRDGTATNVFGEQIYVDTACWVKGTDGRWRQISALYGPDVDAYPSGLRDTYLDLLPDFF